MNTTKKIITKKETKEQNVTVCKKNFEECKNFNSVNSKYNTNTQNFLDKTEKKINEMGIFNNNEL